jgi:phosphatidylglycerol---prolipoprotein diacylglyceryl transferase
MIHWDPNPILIGPVRWYGLFFALGFWGGHQLLWRLYRRLTGGDAQKICDRLIGWILVGALIGARLVHVFAYDWPYYRAHPEQIWRLWEGGLASHGGALGAVAAIWLFARVRKVGFWPLLDLGALAAMIPAGAIRIGNFFNQEVLGTLTSLPWGVAFGHPIDGVSHVARHPVQLYEAFFYWGLGIVAMLLWKRLRPWVGSGAVAGLVLVLVFGFRMLVESIKLEQAQQLPLASHGLMGQLLSLPILLAGLLLISWTYLRRRQGTSA